MDRPKRFSLALPPYSATRVEGPARTRNKLQKGSAKKKACKDGPPKRLEARNVPSHANLKPVDSRIILPPIDRLTWAGGEQSPLTPPVLRHPDNWKGDTRKVRFLSGPNGTPSLPKEARRRRAGVVPELSHLVIARGAPCLSIDALPAHSPADSASTMSTIRRRAKTPVFSIGQLESHSYYPDRLVVDKTSKVEGLADQYIALLEPRDDDSVYTDAHSEPPLSRQGHRDDERELRRLFSSEDLRSAASLQPLSRTNPDALSPTSDDGTLVSFEDETVYFKPVSFSPEPLSPVQNFNAAFAPPYSPSPPSDNLSLQICLDLLKRELSSAVRGRRPGVGTETSALQVWVMIEAYERLRDQIADMRFGLDELGPVEAMLDTWLGALYSIHDALTVQAREPSESEYEGLEEDLD